MRSTTILAPILLATAAVAGPLYTTDGSDSYGGSETTAATTTTTLSVPSNPSGFYGNPDTATTINTLPVLSEPSGFHGRPSAPWPSGVAMPSGYDDGQYHPNSRFDDGQYHPSGVSGYAHPTGGYEHHGHHSRPGGVIGLPSGHFGGPGPVVATPPATTASGVYVNPVVSTSETSMPSATATAGGYGEGDVEDTGDDTDDTEDGSGGSDGGY